MSEDKTNVSERLQEMGNKLGEFRDMVVTQFKDMEVDVRNWNFNVGKIEDEYIIDASLKIVIKPKK